jgi:hypothetical protein
LVQPLSSPCDSLQVLQPSYQEIQSFGYGLQLHVWQPVVAFIWKPYAHLAVGQEIMGHAYAVHLGVP